MKCEETLCLDFRLSFDPDVFLILVSARKRKVSCARVTIVSSGERERRFRRHRYHTEIVSDHVYDYAQ